MKRIKRYISDKWNRARIRIHMLFIRDEKRMMEARVAYALCSEDGRKMLFSAMIREL